MRTMLDNKGIDYYKGNISYNEIVKWIVGIKIKANNKYKTLWCPR